MVITEIGGTVGDIESLPFLEAARQTRHEIGRDNCFFIHVSLVPYIGPSGELKTKPTQHSVAALRSIGIQPDAIVCRADRELPDSIKRKIALMCDVDDEAVVTAADAPSIYDIPKVLHREGLDAYVVRRLDLPFRDVDWTVWDDLLRRVHHPQGGGHRRAGRQVHRPARRLPLGRPRRCAPAASPTRRRCTCAGSPPTSARPGRVPPSTSATSTRSGPGRLRHPRHRGQARRAHLRPHPRHPDARPVPGPAVHGHRVRPQRRRPREGRLDRVRPGRSRAGHLHDRGAEAVRRGRRRPRWHHAARASSRPTLRRGQRRPRGLRRADGSRSGTATATSSTTPTATSSRRPGWSSPASTPTSVWWSSSSCRATCTPTTSPPRRTPSCARARPGRTRCSRA